MRLLRSFPFLTFVLVLLSILGITVAQRSVGLLLVGGALAVISWYITEGPRGRCLPRWVSNVLIIAVALNLAAELFQGGGDLLGAMGRFALWLTVIKLYERRTARDHGHLLALSLLLMLTACLHSTDLFFALILGAYGLLGLYVLLLYQLQAAHERVAAERSAAIPADYRLAPVLRPVTGRSSGGQFRALGMAMAIGGLTLSVIVFVMFPRGLGESVFAGLPERGMVRTTRFAPEIDLIRGGRITDSRRAVMSLRLLDQEGRPMRLAQPLLLRGAVLEHYDGRGRWHPMDPRPWHGSRTVTLDGGEEADLRLLARRARQAARGGSDAIEEPRSAIITQVIDSLEAQPALFSMYAPIAVTSETPTQVQYDRASQIVTAESRFPPRRYSVTAHVAPSDALLGELTPDRRGRLRSLATMDERIAGLAVQLLDESGIEPLPEGPSREQRWRFNREVASAFSRYLQSNFAYTLDMGMAMPRDRTDPVAWFLFDVGRGHCEYFASALALLCRAVGVEARLVTGYVAAEYDDQTGRYHVLESNAHAWVEVRTGPRRWTAFDPTPAAGFRDQHYGEVTLADRMRRFYDRFDSTWTHTVVSFDSTAQSRLADSTWRGAAGEWLSRTAQSVRDWAGRVNRAFYFGPAGYIWLGIVGFAIALLVIVLIRLMRRSLLIRDRLHLQHVRGKEYQRLLVQLGFYIDMLDVLERAGLRKPDWQPPLEFAASLRARRPDLTGPPAGPDCIREITEAFYEARYAHRPLNSEQLARVKSLVRELAGMLKVRL